MGALLFITSSVEKNTGFRVTARTPRAPPTARQLRLIKCLLWPFAIWMAVFIMAKGSR